MEVSERARTEEARAVVLYQNWGTNLRRTLAGPYQTRQSVLEGGWLACHCPSRRPKAKSASRYMAKCIPGLELGSDSSILCKNPFGIKHLRGE